MRWCIELASLRRLTTPLIAQPTPYSVFSGGQNIIAIILLFQFCEVEKSSYSPLVLSSICIFKHILLRKKELKEKNIDCNCERCSDGSEAETGWFWQCDADYGTGVDHIRLVKQTDTSRYGSLACSCGGLVNPHQQGGFSLWQASSYFHNFSSSFNIKIRTRFFGVTTLTNFIPPPVSKWLQVFLHFIIVQINDRDALEMCQLRRRKVFRYLMMLVDIMRIKQNQNENLFLNFEGRS